MYCKVADVFLSVERWVLSWDLRRGEERGWPVWSVRFESPMSLGNGSLWIELFRKVSQTFQSTMDWVLGLEL
jgi:hypothetical protein